MRVVGNFLWLASAEVISKLLTLAAFAYIWRSAGPAGAGAVEFAVSVFLLLGLVVDQGFDAYGAREVARRPDRTSVLAGEIIFTRLAIALAAYAMAVAFISVVDLEPDKARLVLIYCLSLFGLPFLLRWVFQGHDRMGTVALAQVIRQAVFAAVVFASFREGTGLWIAGVAELAGTAAAGIFFVASYRPSFGRLVPVRPRISRELLRDGCTIGLSQMLWSARMFGATLLVGLIAAPAELGYFGVAMKILIALHAFVWLYYFNLLPSLSRSWQADPANLRKLVARSTQLTCWLAIAGAVFWYLLSPAVILLASGPEFAPAVPVLQWLAVVCALAAVSGNARFTLIATGAQSGELAATALGTVAAAVAIPLGYYRGGVEGAAIGLVLGELVVLVAAWMLVRKAAGVRLRWAHVTGPILAGGCAGLAALTVGNANLWLQLSLAAAILIPAAIAFDPAVRGAILGWVGKRADRHEVIANRR